MKDNKVILSISIVIGCIIIGSFFYAVQINKQKSVERQQEMKIQADKYTEEMKAKAIKESEFAKTKLKNKEYMAERLRDCLAIYKTELSKWNNTESWRYDDLNDYCIVRYKKHNPKSDADCDAMFPANSQALSLCKEGMFERKF